MTCVVTNQINEQLERDFMRTFAVSESAKAFDDLSSYNDAIIDMNDEDVPLANSETIEVENVVYNLLNENEDINSLVLNVLKGEPNALHNLKKAYQDEAIKQIQITTGGV